MRPITLLEPSRALLFAPFHAAGVRLSAPVVPMPAWCLKDSLIRLGIDPAASAAIADRTMPGNAAVTEGRPEVAQVFKSPACRAEALVKETLEQ